MANKKQMIGDVPGSTLGMLSDLMLKLKAGSLTSRQLELFLKGKNPFITNINIISEWEKFYKDFFDLTVDLSKVEIPFRKGFERTLIIAQGIDENMVFESCQKNFTAWRWTDDLVKTIERNVRSPKNGSYAVCFRDRQEADEELKNLSANILKEKNIIGITLLERLVYELKYWSETKKHLDIENVTLCSGSRYRGGHVPDVDWRAVRLRVLRYHPDNADSRLRSRESAV